MFNNFFNRGQAAEERRAPDLEIPVRVTLTELLLGTTFDVTFDRQALCPNYRECQRSCPHCAGPGIAVQQQQLMPGFVQNVQVRGRAVPALGGNEAGVWGGGDGGLV